MPERYNFAVLLETPNDHTIRMGLMESTAKVFSSWLEKPTEAFVLGHNISERANWSEADELYKRELSETDILFIYYSKINDKEQSILSISSGSGVTIYGVSLPDTSISRDELALCRVLVEFCCELSPLKIPFIIASGAEVEIAELSVDEVISSVQAWDSLTEFVSCKSADASKFSGFIPIKQIDDCVVLRRAKT